MCLICGDNTCVSIFSCKSLPKEFTTDFDCTKNDLINEDKVFLKKKHKIEFNRNYKYNKSINNLEKKSESTFLSRSIQIKKEKKLKTPRLETLFKKKFGEDNQYKKVKTDYYVTLDPKALFRPYGGLKYSYFEVTEGQAKKNKLSKVEKVEYKYRVIKKWTINFKNKTNHQKILVSHWSNSPITLKEKWQQTLIGWNSAKVINRPKILFIPEYDINIFKEKMLNTVRYMDNLQIVTWKAKGELNDKEVLVAGFGAMRQAMHVYVTELMELINEKFKYERTRYIASDIDMPCTIETYYGCETDYANDSEFDEKDLTYGMDNSVKQVVSTSGDRVEFKKNDLFNDNNKFEVKKKRFIFEGEKFLKKNESKYPIKTKSTYERALKINLGRPPEQLVRLGIGTGYDVNNVCCNEDIDIAAKFLNHVDTQKLINDEALKTAPAKKLTKPIHQNPGNGIDKISDTLFEKLKHTEGNYEDVKLLFMYERYIANKKLKFALKDTGKHSDLIKGHQEHCLTLDDFISIIITAMSNLSVNQDYNAYKMTPAEILRIINVLLDRVNTVSA